MADELIRVGLATVLADLLTGQEEQVDIRTAALRFDMELLAVRVTGSSIDYWLATNIEPGSPAATNGDFR